MVTPVRAGVGLAQDPGQLPGQDQARRPSGRSGQPSNRWSRLLVSLMSAAVLPSSAGAVLVLLDPARDRRLHYLPGLVPVGVSAPRAAMKASWGTSTRPMAFMRLLTLFCFSSSLRLRVMSPP